MTIKVGLGKLNVDLEEIRQYCLESGFIELPVTSEHAIAVKDLEHHHRDPFDRLIVATAMTEPMTLLTADPLVASLPDFQNSLADESAASYILFPVFNLNVMT